MTWLVAPQNDYRAEGGDPPPDTATVVIPVFNRVGLLRRTIAGLVAQTVPVTAVVVDDGSDEDVAAALRAFGGRLDLRLLRQHHDGYGAGRARNLGTAAADTDVVIFVDADCVPAPDLAARHLRHHRFENVAVIGSRRHVTAADIDPEDIAGRSANLEDHVVDDGSRDFRTVLGRRTTRLTSGTEAYRAFVSSNVSVRRGLFLQAGGFSEDFTRWGGEDTELGWRLSEAGGFFVPADDAIVFHQVDLDGPEGWRRADRTENDGLIVSKIPHRFYRRRGGVVIHQVPKVSFVAWPVPDDLQTLADEVLSSTLRDVELVLVGDPDRFEPFTGSVSGDPRVRFAPTAGGDPLADGIRSARGELIISLHGGVAPDRRMAARVAKRMDDRPRISTLTVGYRVFGGEGREEEWQDHLRSDDPRLIDDAWRLASPLVSVGRRRDWNRVLAVTDSAAGWATMRGWDIADHLPQPLAWIPAPTPTERPHRFRVGNQDRDSVRALLRKRRPVAAAKQSLALVRRRPPPRPRPIRSPATRPGPVELRYVGWTGRDNLGDEAMLRACRRLMPWAEISTSGDAIDGLVLGGGTLINRSTYLRWLRERDSPRVERFVFGTGVASPEFWGITEDTDEWLDYLSSCLYVGVRGPASVETLREWGYRGVVEQVGDPALALEAPKVDPVDGHVVVAPAWTRGELWGGADEQVYATLAEAVSQWVERGRSVTLLSCHPDDDRPCVEIMRRAGYPDLPHHFGYLDIDRALQLLASADVVVAERLHAAVLAAACGRPFVAIEYRPKLADFARSVEAARWLIRSDHLGLEGLEAAVETAHEQLVAVGAHVEEYRSRLGKAAASIGEGFGS